VEEVARSRDVFKFSPLNPCHESGLGVSRGLTSKCHQKSTGLESGLAQKYSRHHRAVWEMALKKILISCELLRSRDGVLRLLDNVLNKEKWITLRDVGQDGFKH
jgi:hypothetical protein